MAAIDHAGHFRPRTGDPAGQRAQRGANLSVPQPDGIALPVPRRRYVQHLGGGGLEQGAGVVQPVSPSESDAADGQEGIHRAGHAGVVAAAAAAGVGAHGAGCGRLRSGNARAAREPGGLRLGPRRQLRRAGLAVPFLERQRRRQPCAVVLAVAQRRGAVRRAPAGIGAGRLRLRAAGRRRPRRGAGVAAARAVAFDADHAVLLVQQPRPYTRTVSLQPVRLRVGRAALPVPQRPLVQRPHHPAGRAGAGVSTPG